MAKSVSLTRRERALVVCFRTTDAEGRRLMGRAATAQAKSRPAGNGPDAVAAANRFHRAAQRLGVNVSHVYDLLV